MALIKCPKCGEKISDKAESCSNCGYLLLSTKKKKINKRRVVGIIIIAILIFVNLVGNAGVEAIPPSIIFGVIGLYLIIKKPKIKKNNETQDEEQNKKVKPKKKTSEKVLLVVLLCIFVIGFAFMLKISTINTTQTQIEIILDANEFSKISSENLIEKLGEPVRIEDFIAPNGATCYNYWYDIDKNHYDFYVIDDKVVELIASSENYWTGKGELYKYNKKNKSDIAECFNIKLSQNAKVKDKNITYIVESVSSTVEEINVQDIKSDSKTYGLIKIVYDNSYNK